MREIEKLTVKIWLVTIVVLVGLVAFLFYMATETDAAAHVVNLEDKVKMGNDINDQENKDDHDYNFEFTENIDLTESAQNQVILSITDNVVLTESAQNHLAAVVEDYILMTITLKILYPLKLTDNIYLSDLTIFTQQEILYLRAIMRVLRELRGELE